MNKIIKLNALKASLLTLPTKEKGDICSELIKKDGYTLRGLSNELGTPHTTVHHWINGRESEVLIGLDRMIEWCEKYKFKREDIFKLDKLIEILQLKRKGV